MTALLPEGWSWSTVEAVGRVQLGRQRSPKYHSGDNMKPYLRVANVFENRIDCEDLKYMHFEPAEYERYRLQPGDVLLNEGQTPELLGRPAMYRGLPNDLAFTNSLIRFQAGPRIDPRWALLVFRHHMHSGRFTRESRITTNIAHLSAARFKSVEFPVPPVDDQLRIVDLVDDHLSRLDVAASLVQRALRASELLRTQLVEVEIAALDTVDETVANVAVLVTDGDHNPPKRVQAGVPHVTAKGIRDGAISLEVGTFVSENGYLQTSARYTPTAGDVIVTCVGTIGRVAVVPDGIRFSADRNLAAIRLDQAKMLPEFLALLLQTPRLQAYMTAASGSTAQPHLYLRDLRRLPIRVPALTDQRRVLDRVAERSAPVDISLRQVTRALARVPALRRSVLAGAYSGQLTRLIGRPEGLHV